MPNIRQVQSPYIGPFSNVETFHQNLLGSNAMGPAALFHPGEAGSRVILSETGVGAKEYQLCQIDSGVVAAGPAGAATLGQTFYWKNRQQYIVTNDPRFSQNMLNSSAPTTAGAASTVACVAGIMVTPTASVVPGDWVYLQTKGQCAVVLSASSAQAGDWAIPNASATVPQVTNVAAASAPTATVIGRYVAAIPAAGTATLDLQLPEIP